MPEMQHHRPTDITSEFYNSLIISTLHPTLFSGYDFQNQAYIRLINIIGRADALKQQRNFLRRATLTTEK